MSPPYALVQTLITASALLIPTPTAANLGGHHHHLFYSCDLPSASCYTTNQRRMLLGCK